MAFTEHKITDFAHRLSDLPDQPNLSAAELKAYFDSSPEELRQAVNGICTDAERLDDRVSGIVAETFGDAIPKTMLTEELQAEIDAKAEQTALAAEAAARERADAAFDTRVQVVEAQKTACFFGTYQGDGQPTQEVLLGFAPKAVFVYPQNAQTSNRSGDMRIFSGLAFEDSAAQRSDADPILTLTKSGFVVYYENYPNCGWTNASGYTFHFIAFH